jgi:hypothetical protein
MNKLFVKSINTLCTVLATAVIFFSPNFNAYAAEIPDTYTNENFWSSEHDQPVSFQKDAEGNFSGITRTGKTFTQRNIANNLTIRLQRFAIDEAFFYISDKGIIIAANNMMALSIYLNRNA